MIETLIPYYFVLTLFMPGLCDTQNCADQKGKVVSTNVLTDETHCNRVRKLVADQFGGEANINGTLSRCESRSKP